MLTTVITHGSVVTDAHDGFIKNAKKLMATTGPYTDRINVQIAVVLLPPLKPPYQTFPFLPLQP